MSFTLGVVMDEIATIHYATDSTLAMLFEALRRGFRLFYFEQKDLLMKDGVPFGYAKPLTVFKDPARWWQLGEARLLPLTDCQMILMRKDPPVDRTYLYTTYLLSYAEQLGVKIVNRPGALASCNEKFFISSFNEFAPPTLITQSIPTLHEFLSLHQEIVCKPLHGRGGMQVFHVRLGDDNVNVIFEHLTQCGTAFMMAQKFIPEITQGDKRILLIHGAPFPYMLVRLPKPGDWRGNLSAGASSLVQPLGQHERMIAETVGRTLLTQGLYFVGLDMIGRYLTEINITSPTGIREIDTSTASNVSRDLFDALLR